MILSACHAGLLADSRTPVGSGRFREHAQDPRVVLGLSFASSLSEVNISKPAFCTLSWSKQKNGSHFVRDE